MRRWSVRIVVLSTLRFRVEDDGVVVPAHRKVRDGRGTRGFVEDAAEKQKQIRCGKDNKKATATARATTEAEADSLRE